MPLPKIRIQPLEVDPTNIPCPKDREIVAFYAYLKKTSPVFRPLPSWWQPVVLSLSKHLSVLILQDWFSRISLPHSEAIPRSISLAFSDRKNWLTPITFLLIFPDILCIYLQLSSPNPTFSDTNLVVSLRLLHVLHSPFPLQKQVKFSEHTVVAQRTMTVSVL
jgi:hypothetical protein